MARSWRWAVSSVLAESSAGSFLQDHRHWIRSGKVVLIYRGKPALLDVQQKVGSRRRVRLQLEIARGAGHDGFIIVVFDADPSPGDGRRRTVDNPAAHRR